MTDAILVYTEPSSTLVVAVYDNAFLETPEGEALEASLSPLAQVEGDLPDMSPSVLLATPPPSNDSSVRIVAYGEYDGTAFSGEELTNMSTDLSLFSLQLSIVGIGGGGTLEVEQCCRCGASKRDCGCVTDCMSPFCDCINCEMTCTD